MSYSGVTSRPLTLGKSVEAEVYMLFAVALGLTSTGIFVGIQYSTALLGSGIQVVFLIAELILIFTSRLWVDKTPLNYLLFGLFPVLSGITITPYVLSILAGYANGGVILMNAFLATVCMAGASAVFAKVTHWNLGFLGRALFFGLLGLIALGILQIFVPAFASTQMELLISGGGVLFFAVFTAYDIQRIAQLSRTGASPFLLALSLYLDIFNMFLYVLRFMLAIYGNRR